MAMMRGTGSHTPIHCSLLIDFLVHLGECRVRIPAPQLTGNFVSQQVDDGQVLRAHLLAFLAANALVCGCGALDHEAVLDCLGVERARSI